MPALPDAPKVLRFDHHFIIGEDSNAKSRFFMQYTGSAPSTADLNAIGAEVSTSWNANLKPLQDTATEFTTITITDLSSSTSSSITSSILLEGTLSGEPLPADVCALQSWVITRRYRGGRRLC